jgi:hypothetical protein
MSQYSDVNIMKCSMLHEGENLRSNICAFYSLEMALMFGFDASFDNLQDWKGIRENSREVNPNSTTACTTNDEIPR